MLGAVFFVTAAQAQPATAHARMAVSSEAGQHSPTLPLEHAHPPPSRLAPPPPSGLAMADPPARSRSAQVEEC
jgi:hypothetical protein